MDTTSRILLDGTIIDNGEPSEFARDPFLKDQDILLYSSAFARLKGVTQVQPVLPGISRGHDRFIHSLKVAQVGKRIAERLVKTEGEQAAAVLPETVYFAGLAHDIGHPPFGHIAESELNRILLDPQFGEVLPDGFEGNAQSLRILVRSAQKTCRDPNLVESSQCRRGMGLTAGSLIAVMKYPWSKGHSRYDLGRIGRNETPREHGAHKKKWGVYDDDVAVWHTLREGFLANNNRYVINSEIMNLADDITYAVHDIADSYRSGDIPPIGSIFANKSFQDHVQARLISDTSLNLQQTEIRSAFNWLGRILGGSDGRSGVIFRTMSQYRDTRTDRAVVHQFESDVVANVMQNVSIDEQGRLLVPPVVSCALEILKQITWHFAIENPRLSASQRGQTKIVRELHDALCGWYQDSQVDPDDLHARQKQSEKDRRFPQRFLDMVTDTRGSKVRRLDVFADDGDLVYQDMSDGQRVRRGAADYIVSLTDDETIRLHHMLCGVGPMTPLSFI